MQHQAHNTTSSASSAAGSGAAGLLSLWGLESEARAAGAHQRDQNMIRLITAMAEREAAVLEKTAALAEKKTAMAERDSALMQRDLALADRDSAATERDRAMEALNRIRAEQDTCPNCHWNRHPAYNFTVGGAKYPLMAGSPENIQPLAAIAQTEELFLEGGAAPKKKRKKSAKLKGEVKEGRKPNKQKKDQNLSSSVMPNAKLPQGSTQTKNSQLSDEKPQKIPTEKRMLRNVAFHVPLFDCSKIPSPYCSCTGVNEQCYRWGNGGWQSACCTNTMSMYPLPMSPKKKGCRLAGRKMSAGAFERLLQRLVSDGWDVNMPVDLKSYWAKHGTNRYVTIK